VYVDAFKFARHGDVKSAKAGPKAGLQLNPAKKVERE
jgi:hypothetical protein